MASQRDGGIAWTDETWNPIRGCSRVSEGCRNCYAEVVAARFSGPGQAYEGLARRTSKGEARWTGKIMFVEKHLLDPLRWKEPRRIFVNSMSDLFHEDVSDEQLDRIFAVMALADRHQFQVLTKRPQRMLEYVNEPGRCRAVASAIARIGNRQPRQGLADSEAKGRAAGARRRISKGIESLSLQESPCGVEDSPGLPGDLGNAQRKANERVSASSGVGSSARSNSARDYDQSPERSEGQQRAVESRTSDLIGTAPSRVGCPTGSKEPAKRITASEDTPHRGGRSGNTRATAAGRSGEGSGGTIPDEAEGNLGDLLPEDLETHLAWPLPNLWLGVSVENQAAADERIPILLDTPAAVRFLSCEPLLGPLQFPLPCKDSRFWSDLHWIICGGESGAHARPCDVEWIRDIVKQCADAKVPCFIKQMGKWITGDHTGHGCTGFDTGFVVNRWLLDDGRVFIPPIIGANAHARPANAIAFGNCDTHGGNWIEWPEDLRVREFPSEVSA